jgi:hypothetical protein
MRIKHLLLPAVNVTRRSNERRRAAAMVAHHLIDAPGNRREIGGNAVGASDPVEPVDEGRLAKARRSP